MGWQPDISVLSPASMKDVVLEFTLKHYTDVLLLPVISFLCMVQLLSLL
jgi:hypothetical protein